MNNSLETSKLILNRVYEKFHCPGRVFKWEGDFYIVEVYNIPASARDKMKDDIIDLEYEFFPEMEFLFLPMVYTPEETMEAFADECQESLAELMNGAWQKPDSLPECYVNRKPSSKSDALMEDCKAA